MQNHDIDKMTEKAWEMRLIDIQASYRSALELLTVSESSFYLKGIADASKILGYCYWRFSDFSLSLSNSLKALKIYEKSGDRKGESDTLNNIGAVYMFQNDHKRRLEVNLKCKAIRQEIGDLEGVASSEGNIGETYFEMGDYTNASKCFHAVLSNPDASPQGTAWAYHNLGKVHLVKTDSSVAERYFLLGLEVSKSVDYKVLISDSYLALAELYLNQGNHDKAIIQSENALSVSRSIGAKEGEKKALYFLSKIYEDLNLFEESLRYHKDFHSIEQEISRDTEIEKLKTIQLKVAFDKIEEQRNELLNSIKYAERIQTAILTREQREDLLKDYFVLYKPKDIVSGDFYWYHEKGDHFYLCVADCTGHGVPGAFLTMLGTTYLSEIITSNEFISPSNILEDLRNRIIRALALSEDRIRQDGMDISLVRLNTRTYEAEWAGAYNPLWIVRAKNNYSGDDLVQFKALDDSNTRLYELRGDRQPISLSDNMKPFTNHSFKLLEGDKLYLFSDGFAHQFGGQLGKKYGSGAMQKLILKIFESDMSVQKKMLNDEIENWKADREQVDDICIIGFEI